MYGKNIKVEPIDENTEGLYTKNIKVEPIDENTEGLYTKNIKVEPIDENTEGLYTKNIKAEPRTPESNYLIENIKAEPDTPESYYFIENNEIEPIDENVQGSNISLDYHTNVSNNMSSHIKNIKVEPVDEMQGYSYSLNLKAQSNNIDNKMSSHTVETFVSQSVEVKDNVSTATRKQQYKRNEKKQIRCIVCNKKYIYKKCLDKHLKGHSKDVSSL